ncbi:MAG: DUF5979 domain-containing protein, partial [Oscillospiraceae bacterium]|nr:DUF5979 domain-containing protein [Oscillospiraceae bacterium]
DTAWPAGVTTDTMSGYVAAAPWALSGAMRRDADAVNWLITNGYRGDYLADNSESRASVERLNALFPNIGFIDKKIALMATKVAVWMVLAGSDVEITGTSLDGDEIKRDTFYALTDALLSRAGGPADESTTSFAIALDDSVAEHSRDSEYHYYGPLTVSAEIKNSSGALNIAGVFLTVSGPDSVDVEIVKEIGGSAFPSDTVYGTTVSGFYLDTYDSDFYLKMPNARGENYNSPADLLTVKAMARAKDVLLTAGTPVTFVYGADGVFDWDYVQAYAGAAADGMYADFYAETMLNTGESPTGKLHISKRVANASPLDSGAEFEFELYVSVEPDFSDEKQVDLSTHPVHGASKVSGNTFTLKNGGVAIIEGLPAGDDYSYRIKEIGLPAAYHASSFNGVSTLPVDNSVSSDRFTIDGYEATVNIVNFKQQAHLYVSKSVVSADDSPASEFTEDMAFDFILECSEDGNDPWTPVDLNGIFKSDGGVIKDAEAGIFTLGASDKAFFDLDSEIIYRVSEIEPGPDFIPSYTYINSSAGSETSDNGDPDRLGTGGIYSAESFFLDQNETGILTFTNAYGFDKSPETPKKPESGGPETSPAFPDDSDGPGPSATNPRTSEGAIPTPTAPGNSLVTEGERYVEVDEGGVPLGVWNWDEDEQIWIFSEYPPLGDMPATGDVQKFAYLLPLLIISGINVYIMLRLKEKEYGK